MIIYERRDSTHHYVLQVATGRPISSLRWLGQAEQRNSTPQAAQAAQARLTAVPTCESYVNFHQSPILGWNWAICVS